MKTTHSRLIENYLPNLLKELDLTEGRGTGIPKILRRIKANNSPLPRFLTDEDRTYFVVEFPIHRAFLPKKTRKEKNMENGEGKVLQLLMEKANLTIQDISRQLDISTRTVDKYICTLKESGKLKREGGRKSGCWEVIARH